MGAVEMELKDLILSRYKSVLEFSKAISMPYTTIDTIFKRGLMNANIANILKICAALNIDTESLANGEIAATKPKAKMANTIIIINSSGEREEYAVGNSELEVIKRMLDGLKK